jgi:hypothetical protein
MLSLYHMARTIASLNQNKRNHKYMDCYPIKDLNYMWPLWIQA